MSGAPPNPTRDAEIVRLYPDTPKRELAARLGVSEHVVTGVAKKFGLRRKPGPEAGRPTGRAVTASLGGEPIGDAEHRDFMVETAKSSDALLAALGRHHRDGTGECAMRPSPGLARRLVPEIGLSLTGSSAAMCADDRGRM